MVLGRKKKEVGPSQNLQQPVNNTNDERTTSNVRLKRKDKKQMNGNVQVKPQPAASKTRQIPPVETYKKKKRPILEILGLKNPEPQIKDEMITWEEFVKMFFEGRTHTLYGQIFNMFLAIFLIVLSFDTGNVLLFVVSLLILIVAVGSAVDITAHLWYH
ncbi:MAG: hypothetical protein ACYCR7_06135 [Thermoplasmataceae archaeon]